MKYYKEREYITIVKGFAIISIVCAHVGFVTTDTNMFNKVTGLILESLGSIGVCVFLLISGYLFYHNKKPIVVFFKSRIKTILIPWIFCGTMIFLYITIRKGEGNFVNWFLFLTQHSYLFYLSILMISYILFWRLKDENWFLLLMIVLSIFSITLTGIGILKIYPYTNPLNWSIYFSMGLILKKHDILKKVMLLCYKSILPIIILYTSILFIYIVNGTYISYWKYASIISEILAIAMVLGLSMYFFNSKNNKYLLMIGEMSFAIYLLHMPVAGIITKLFNEYNVWYLTLTRPLIVISITMIGIELMRFLSIIIKMNKLFDLLIGLNRYKN